MLLSIRDLISKALQGDDGCCSKNCQKGLGSLEQFPRPRQRQRPFTPTLSDTTAVQHQSCLFFTRLPLEIRRLIMVQAFGERTLHMDLQHKEYNYKSATVSGDMEAFRVRTQHTLPVVGGCGPFQHGNYYSSPDYNQKQQWRWWGSVCHRNLPNNVLGSMGARDGQSRAPWDDDCLNGNARYCTEWGRPGVDCNIDALGFLRCCKQTYIEGLDVLYKTNTIHISSSTLFPRLPRLIIPERLSNIVSLEVVWDHHELRSSLWGPPRPAQLPLYLHVLSDHLTGLERIFISIVRVIAPSHANMEEDVLKQLDNFVQSTPRLKKLCVSVPWYCFANSIVATVKSLPEVFRGSGSGKFTPLHIWRPLSDEHVAIDVGSSPCPNPPEGVPNHCGDGRLSGYWILEGHDRDGDRDVFLEDPS